ncbi:MAG: tRNA (guanosine(37)-N1)-methyltransferase TrmD [Desulfobulbus sp.]|jgi:tRNA (guanine37-N1)-methyltransferase
MRFDILTIFPELLSSPLQEGILRRALAAEQIRVAVHNIRDFALDRHRMTDDRPFGGGEGMVMKPEPLAACLRAIERVDGARVILLSPKGRRFDQQTAVRLSGYGQLMLVCGRYEGVDDRFEAGYIDEVLSIGDYVLTGGELAALVVLDAVTRLLPGVLGCEDSAANDSFSRGLLKHRQYTRPRVFEGESVPEVLLSGDHAAIARYRFLDSVAITLERRPDLFNGLVFTTGEWKMLQQAGMADRVRTLGGQSGQPSA